MLYDDFMDLLKDLNEAQKKAVLHKDGPLLVLAGAGAGKTRAIAHRVAYLVNQGVEPERILAITFTNKAAEEMKKRINKLLTTDYSRLTTPFISTFHSLCAYILRKSGRSLGLKKNFTILDKEDSLALIKEAIRDINLDSRQFQPGKIQAIISRYKGDLVINKEFADFCGSDFFPATLNKIWDGYEEKLQKQNALDFDDLIFKSVLLLKKDEETRNYYQNYWQYILIDEYQDTNKAQYELSRILAEKHRNICAIADGDQAIYGWRGADFRNIINFENDYPEHTTIIFEENYRSTQNILEAAAKVIEKNKIRKPKKLLATKEKGAAMSLFEAMNEEEEAEFVVHKIQELLKTKVKLSEIGVLFRANFQSRIFEEACLKHQIPHQAIDLQDNHLESSRRQSAFQRKKEAVRLITAHSAKGLEFKIVFVTGLEEGLFPYLRRENSEEEKEEERRLFYVAITRAKEKVFLSFSISRTISGAKQLNLPSQFLADIPDHLLKIEKYNKKEEIIEYL
jgi:DNA helicase-2/ATP-dependent DNA helicase PcrA